MKQYLLSAIAISVAASACVDDDASIRILRNQLPEEDCVVSLSPDGDFLSRGIIDTNALSGYLLTPLMESRTESTEGAERLYYIEGANIDVRFSGNIFSDAEVAEMNDQGLSRFRQPLSGAVEAGGFAAFTFEVISKALLDRIGGKLADAESTTVFVDVTMVGEISGSSTDSKLFTYPVEVCKGCLLRNLGACTAINANQEISTGGNCQALQDGVLDCCIKSDGGTSCPAVPEVPAEDPPA